MSVYLKYAFNYSKSVTHYKKIFYEGLHVRNSQACPQLHNVVIYYIKNIL